MGIQKDVYSGAGNVVLGWGWDKKSSSVSRW